MMVLAWVGLGLLLVLGAPLFVCLGGLALLLLAQAGLDWQIIAIEINRITSSPNLIVIPLFAYSGVLLARSGMPARSIEVARALFGWIPGAAAIVTLLIFEFFTAFTGASGISILATGPMLLSMLKGAGYSERFSLGLISSAGSLGVLLPPSIVVIFYGTLTRTPIETLFKAALLPGAVMVVALGAFCLWRGRLELKREPFEPRRLARALWVSRYELPMPVLVLGGIYLGFLTVAEAALALALYVTLIESLVLKEIHWRKHLPEVMLEAVELVGAILVVLGVALGLTNALIDAGLPEWVQETVTTHISGRVQFLLAVNVLLLLAGCVLDVFSAIILLVPILLPLAQLYEVHPLHLGVIFLANLEIGYSTPPVGLNLFVASLTFGRPMGEIVRAVLPFVLILLISVLVITFVPELTLWVVGG